MALESQDSLDALIPLPDASEPVTPQPPHATIDNATAAEVGKIQANRVDHAVDNMTPPPSTQVPSSIRIKDRTPTPTFSSISTPPPTIDYASHSQQTKPGPAFTTVMTVEQIANAPAEELREAVAELQTVYQEAKMGAAHYKLQYQMLTQESAAAIERMAVEARMAQYENDVIHIAEQAKAAATPVQPSPVQEGMIPVQKDLYQRMCREIQLLTETTNNLSNETRQQEKIILKQEAEIETLTDKVSLMRDRIRQNRNHLNRLRRPSSTVNAELTPRSTYTATPHRGNTGGQDQFAALLQASEIASQEARVNRPGANRTSGKKAAQGRAAPGTSSVPTTPHRYDKQMSAAVYATPSRQHQMNVPSTAPLPRTGGHRTLDIYSQPGLPISSSAPLRHVMPQIPPAPRSEDTVSNSDRDVDSEAETDIIEAGGEVSESQASKAASLMLRSSQEEDLQAARQSHTQSRAGANLKQARLFGAVRKSGVDRDDGERPAKRAKIVEGVGLGILGART